MHLLFVFFSLISCMKPSPPAVMAEGEPIAVAISVDNSGVLVPRGLEEALYQNLVEHGLSPKGGFTLGAGRNQAHRLQSLDELSSTPYVLVVQTNVSYYSQIAGRFRWTIHVKFAVSRDGGADAIFREIDQPVFLLFAHQKEAAALEQAAPMLARRLAEIVEELLGAS